MSRCERCGVDAEREKRLAYGRGYNTGRGRKWPLYEPMPTEPKVKEIAEAALELAGDVDTLFATTFDPEDRDNDFLGLESSRIRVLDALDALTEFTFGESVARLSPAKDTPARDAVDGENE